MKKKLTTVTLLLATALSATGCDEDKVTLKEEDGNSIIFSIQNGNEVINYTADEFLNDFQDNSSTTAGLYSEIAKVVFTKYGEAKLDASKLKSLKEDAADELDEFKETCKSEASEADTDYDSYLEDALNTRGVETLDELEDLYYYNAIKTEVLEDYLEETSHYNYFLEKYLQAYRPYQVKHILVAANTSDTKYADGTMTTTNASKLLSVLNKFLDDEKFEDIAAYTDDTSSADNGGVMPFNEAQNYVSEFRFATYVQEIFQNHSTLAERYEVAGKLHIINTEPDTKDYVTQEEFEESTLYKQYANGIGAVDVNDILKLSEKVTKDMKGAFNYYYLTDDTAANYETEKDSSLTKTVASQPYLTDPYEDKDDETNKKFYYEEYELERNVIFNNTLNCHKVQYIALGDKANDVATNKTTVKIDGTDTVVLADEYGNPIFVAYASTGIHFMAMVWNSFEGKGTYTSQYISDEAKASFRKLLGLEETAELTQAQLNQAYFTLFDDEETDLSKYQYTYIGQHDDYLDKKALASNSDDLLADISSYVSNVEYYLFDALVYADDETVALRDGDPFTVTFYDKDLENSIFDLVKEYVEDSMGDTDGDYAESMRTAVEAYADKLARAEEVRTAAGYNLMK